jgi:hypothetical protein
MTPDATRHNPDPHYLRQLLQAADLNQVQAAACLGIHTRTLRYYLSEPDSTDYRPAPYLVQFALECAAAAKAAPVPLPALASGPVARPDLSDWRALDEADVEAQAPAGLSWAEAWATVEQAVAERFAQLPEYLQGGGLADGQRWPPAALDPLLFAQVMAGHAAVVQGLRAQLDGMVKWLLADADQPGPTLHRLLAAERNRGRLLAWEALDVIEAAELGPLRGRVEQLSERLSELIAEQARAGDVFLVPWALAPETPSPVPPLWSLPHADVAGRKRAQQAEAEWQARHLEHMAATWLANAEALRHQHGGGARTAAALAAVTRHTLP